MSSTCVWLAAAVAVSGCGNSYRTKTRAYVATEACGQGPFDVVVPADATTGDEGMEVIACTPRRLAGHVSLAAGDLPVWSGPFGDVADNQRCLGGRPIDAVAGSAPAGASSRRGGDVAGEVHATSGNLSERPFASSETPFAEELCAPYGMQAQTILGTTTLARPTGSTYIQRGGTLRLRIWSEMPNDLEGVVFLVRHVTSNRTMAEAAKDQEAWQKKWEREDRGGTAATPTPPTSPKPPPPEVPPPALTEERPPAPSSIATWVSGYWLRTSKGWGWVAGFWRDDRMAQPAPQVEVPGAPPHAGAVWIGGTWTLHAGAHIWVRGRWR